MLRGEIEERQIRVLEDEVGTQLLTRGCSRRRTDTGEALGKFWLRRRAHRFKPSTDVYLGVSFTAVMPGSGGVGGFRVPPVHGEVGISTSNHEPVDAIGGNESTDFTPEFLQRCHEFSPAYRLFVIFSPRSRLVAD